MRSWNFLGLFGWNDSGWNGSLHDIVILTALLAMLTVVITLLVMLLRTTF